MTLRGAAEKKRKAHLLLKNCSLIQPQQQKAYGQRHDIGVPGILPTHTSYFTSHNNLNTNKPDHLGKFSECSMNMYMRRECGLQPSYLSKLGQQNGWNTHGFKAKPNRLGIFSEISRNKYVINEELRVWAISHFFCLKLGQGVKAANKNDGKVLTGNFKP